MDAMTRVTKYGKPHYFITMTCNPQWPEIVNNLPPTQTAADRPDLVVRVFNQQLVILQPDVPLNQNTLNGTTELTQFFQTMCDPNVRRCPNLRHLLHCIGGLDTLMYLPL